MIDAAVSKLATYALRTGLIEENEYTWAINTILDVLKLDQAFFLSASDPGRRDTVVASVLAMARRLSMRTVAEGVESAGEARLLREMGCDYIQGYVYSRPVPAEQYLQQVRKALDGGAAPSPGQG